MDDHSHKVIKLKMQNILRLCLQLAKFKTSQAQQQNCQSPLIIKQPITSQKLRNNIRNLQQIIFFMKQKLAFSLLFVLVLSNVQPHPAPVLSHVPKTYKVNVDDAPMVRWAPIVNDYKKQIKEFVDYMFSHLPFPKTFFREVEWYAKHEFKYQDFVAQVDAISKLAGQPFERVFFLNFMYEFSTFKACSGVLVRTDEGKIIHGRNLDFNMWEYLSNLVANVQYYRGDKLLYSVDTLVGSVFTLTANKPGAFSVQVNTRTERHFYDDFVNVLMENAIPTCWLLKKVVDQEATFDNAVRRLKTQRIGGPVYFVVSGTKGYEGIIIERNNDNVHGFYSLSESNWYLVQTNYDRSVPDPSDDYRRLPAETKLKARGNKNFSQQDLFDVVMSQYPTFNLATILTVVMVSASGYHNTTVWYGQNPTSPEKNLAIQ